MEPTEKTESEKKESCSHTCPLSCLPLAFWQRLIRPPFRKRHPIVFWIGIVIVASVVLFGLKGFFADKDSVAGRDCIALVSIEGPIMDSGPTLEWLHALENKPEVKGLLVRVNSPGGGAAASQEIYSALARIGKKLPVAVSMGATAASGGLMISMAGARIFANPSTITGSIGVRMDIPQLQGLMGKLGIGQETLVTAPFKDAASYTHPLTPEDRAYLEAVLRDMHDQFVNIVAECRHMSHEQAAALANGKIYTGQEAQKLGLVDEMGGQYETHAWLAAQTGVPFSQKLYSKPSRRKRLIESLLSLADPSEWSTFLQNAPRPAPAFLYQFAW